MSIGSFRLPLMPAPESTEGWKVQFFDPFGNLLKTQYVANGQDATPPTPPTFDLLTFTAWNNPYTNVTRDTDIGAIYDTTDGKTYIFVSVFALAGLQPTIYLEKSTTAEMTIDWGHGASSVTNSSGSITIQKPTAYVAGDYTITITCSGTYRLGQNWTMGLFGASDSLWCNIASKIYVGANVNVLNNYCFRNFSRLEYITLNSELTGNTAAASFQGNGMLKAVVYPSGITGNISSSTFISCGALKVVVFSSLMTGRLEAYSIQNCFDLFNCILPVGLTGSIGAYALYFLPIEKLILPEGLTGNIGINALQNMYNVKLLKLPPSLSGSIGNVALRGLRNLKSITIPAGVTSLGTQALMDSYSMLEYIFESTTPPTLASTDVFSQIRLFSKIYVPHNSVNAYKTATNWSTYADYIYSINDRP